MKTTNNTNAINFDRYDFGQIMQIFNLSDYMREQEPQICDLWENSTLGQIVALCPHFEEIADSFEEFLDSAANQIALQEGEEWAEAHPLGEVVEALRAELTPDEPKDTDPDRVRFHIYAGYYELYLTTGILPAPYMYQTTFDDIEDALAYMEYRDPEAQIFCESVRYLLPDYMQEIQRDCETWDAFTFYDDHKYAVSLFMHHCRTTSDIFAINEKMHYARQIGAITPTDYDYIMQHYDYFMDEAANNRAAA